MSDAPDDTAPGIAIIGMAGRFPGADTTESFWENLCAGVESITHFADDELDDWFSAEERRSADYVKARPILTDVDQFDAEFFGMYANEAALTDPQHRVFLECSWQALEDGGYDPAVYSGAIGVFAGSSMNTYFLNNVCADRATIERFTTSFQVGGYPMLVGAGREFLSTRVAYKLGLTGPAITVQTACSTSLVAVAQACQSLLLFQTDMALAGGVSISFPQQRGYMHLDGGMVSADGHCRTFDAAASGTIFGSGAGVVLLKRLEDAVADGDRIYAVIRGVGVNNDGAGKVGFTAPSADGQAIAIEQALAVAGVDARDISYIECHGTATPLGDPIEVAGLTKAFRRSTDAVQFCALGSVKTNVGHLDAAAGVTGLIKTALALRHELLPATLHYEAPNPQIDFAASPFFVNSTLTAWPASDRPRRAGVSSFGVGGTNAHAILEEAPAPQPRAEAADRPELLVLSARTEQALTEARVRLAAHLRRHPETRLDDVAATLQSGRRHFKHRQALIARDRDDALRQLDQPASTAIVAPLTAGPASLAFLFPGQGAQYPQMGRDLYDGEPVFRNAVDRCAALLQPLTGLDIRTYLYPEDTETAASLVSTLITQPAIFTVEYALAQLWFSWGLAPRTMIGHSIGEFVVACLAGVFSLEDALAIVAARGRLMQDLPGGAMLAVRLAPDEIEPLLPASLAIAAINAPSLVVVAGPSDAIAGLQADLDAQGTMTRLLATSHAFHSPMMDPMVDRLRALVADVSLSPPRFPYISTVTGRWIDAAEATSADYWARHAREPVLFHAALTTLAEQEAPLLLEVGPGNALSNLARQAFRGTGRHAFASLPDPERQTDDLTTLLTVLGQLWSQGVDIDFPAVRGGNGRRIALPTYPFQRTRHWIAPPARSQDSSDPAVPRTDLIPEAVLQEPTAMTETKSPPRNDIGAMIATVIEELSGESMATVEPGLSFLAMGFDSLFLGQVAQRLESQTKVKITFRQLLGEQSTIEKLAAFLAERMPAPLAAPKVSMPAPAPIPVSSAPPAAGMETLFRDQMETMKALFDRQLETLRLTGNAAPAPSAAPALPAPAAVSAPQVADETTPSRFQAYRAGAKPASLEPTPAQRTHIEALSERYCRKTAGSKRLTAQYRPVLADPRAAAGFRMDWKEMVYPIVCDHSSGSRIWDVDGNEYIDLVNGYGQTAFGHAPAFVTQAVSEQLARGFAIGPQSALAGQIAELFHEMTGNERMTFCNTGSEAVMAGLRIARAVTGRTKVVVFDGAYHGQFDEVLVKGLARSSDQPRSMPVAPGIPNSAVGNMVVLDYATPHALEWIRTHADELAAVVVEPVQSRHPALRPVEFLKEIRAITEASGTAFILDEVVTGFRVHPGGMQAVMGIRADMVTYGKVVGGGLPIGILAGKAAFMDALDGGPWSYGDASVPEAAVTFFAGTFVRHPLTLAATWAVLDHLKSEGSALQERLAMRTEGLVGRLGDLFNAHGIVARIESFSSFFYFSLAAEAPLAGLLFHHLRYRGIHIQDGFPCFLTTAHSDADLDAIVAAFEESLSELAAAGIISAKSALATVRSGSGIPLTESQLEIWLAAQFGDDASCAFNESVAISLTGPLDRDALQAALDGVVHRHEALRARFSPTGETITIAPAEPTGYMFHDLIGKNTEEALDAVIAEDARTPFDLVKGPALRAHLAQLATKSHVLILTAHHIVCDGWSINIIVQELAEIYTAAVEKRPAALPTALRFSEYARAEAASADQRATTERFWLEKFAVLPPPLELPTDRPRPAVRSFNGASRSRQIDTDLYKRVKAAGAAQESTLFVTLLAAFELLMGRLADQRAVVIGVPTAGQSLIDDEAPLVGHCVNFLPIRGRWRTSTTIAEHLRAVSAEALDAYEHQNYTFGTLVRKLAMPREMNRLPLAEVQFNLERLSDRMEMPGLAVSVRPNPKAFVNFDLFLNVIESKHGLRLDCDYNTDLWDAATIDRWLDYYETVLQFIARGSETSLARIEILPATERERLLVDLNATQSAFPNESCIHELVAQRAAQQPDHIAVTAGTVRMSYHQLDQAANRMARLIAERGAEPGRLVGICVERSAEMLVALLATLKAGCAYVPLDPHHPDERRRMMAADAALALLIVSDAELGSIVPAGTPIIDLASDQATLAQQPSTAPPISHNADQLAYVIYTSGSTGRPKGVEICHRSVVNLLTSMAREPGFEREDTLLAVTTIAFDIAALELFLPLVVGGTVAIAGYEEARDGFALKAKIAASGATVMQATPATWRLLRAADFDAPPDFKMLCGGEALPRELAGELLAGGGRLWNMYGPTETTIWSSCAEVTADTAEISIGRPIANTELHILDRYDRPTPIGVFGQLHIGGEGLAHGYFRATELTLDKFIANPLGTASPRLYRTGDSARRLANGDIVLGGRMDHQVKLRGFRVELGEVEAAIGRQAGVAACAVALRPGPSGTPQLVGYVVTREETSALLARLRTAVAAVLPDYMVPASWMFLPALPLSGNGKLDRAALPTPTVAAPLIEQDQPSTELEIKLARIWREVLKRDRIGSDEDLLDLGADSIHFFQITARANHEGIRIAAKQLLKYRTIAALAAHLDATSVPNAVATESQVRAV